MEKMNDLRRFGLFDVNAPRYTSYPPANQFGVQTGLRHQAQWLDAVPADKPVSVYVHIPFCKRICWFCACRTQGTKTLRPVARYLETVLTEIAAVGQRLPNGIKMARLHLGGGTPTLLSPELLQRLIDAIDAVFDRSDDFEFSVEIDPTEAAPEVLEALVANQLSRVSIGVQDFDPKVQEAIGRTQTFEQTKTVIDWLRGQGVHNINLDLLYGLPWQSGTRFRATLAQVMTLAPTRLAIYGYAHVPWMSKRQTMIPTAALPGPKARFELANCARDTFSAEGYVPIGIDHFARPEDSLSQAQANQQLKRNFQGYSDDPAETLIGFGASAISTFPGGFSQNAAATSAYQARVANDGLAGMRGFVMDIDDQVIARCIEQLMCYFAIDRAALSALPADRVAEVWARFAPLSDAFPDALSVSADRIAINDGFQPLVRILAHHLDTYVADSDAHSAAI
ncbi:oxygen-independent coproporphyrinogen III oxidase [Sulfitobacter sp. TSTF-M16]|uniref:Coproporphyrinogen-III oxidase n=1 Tax=Sulfitobacter aestuariivivens TaxID=2766981 RepID=A0A927D6J6_9RHOB|nr:oxygen-independent coproporphyrinogen III oxidase [Sulfitobacter aestuariivivens]MBD3664137.1 oxygen-independent coproporphyrinogen III oxidase [Sulfitobacter aestuariivivens]